MLWTTHLYKPKLTIFVFCAITNSEKETENNSSYKLDTVYLDIHHLKTAVKQKWHRLMKEDIKNKPFKSVC